MKIFAFILFAILSSRMFGQADEFNKLLKQYAFNDFRWKEQPPIALQNSKELIVPHIISQDTLQVIKWNDIDSARILGFSNGNVRIAVYGKFIKYLKCEENENCGARYFDTLYKVAGVSDSIFIPLTLKIHGKEPVFSNKIRKHFRNILHQLNNNPITEHYSAPDIGQTVFYNRKKKEITICSNCGYDKTSTYLTAKNLKSAKKITLNGILKILSFDLYIVQKEKSFHITNIGEELNPECITILKTLQPGNSLIFDQIVVQAPDGSRRTIQSPGFVIK